MAERLSIEELHRTDEWRDLATEQMRVFIDAYISTGDAVFAYQSAYGGSEISAKKSCYSILCRKAVVNVLDRWKNLSNAEITIRTLRHIMNSPKSSATAKANAAIEMARLLQPKPAAPSEVAVPETAADEKIPEAPAAQAHAPEPPAPAPVRFTVGQQYTSRDGTKYEIVEVDAVGNALAAKNIATGEIERA